MNDMFFSTLEKRERESWNMTEFNPFFLGVASSSQKVAQFLKEVPEYSALLLSLPQGTN